MQRNARRIVLDLLQRRSQRTRIACNLGAQTVGLELTRPRDGHLDERGSQRRQDGHGDRGDGVGGAPFLVTTAEEHGEVGQRRDGTRHGGRDGGNENVAVLHVGQLVRHHAAHLAGIEHAQQARGGRHGGVLRVAARGEGVGRILVDEVDARHGQASPLGQLLHGLIELRCGRRIDLTGAIHLQHHLVREPVGEEIGDHREAQRHDHAVLATDGGADDTEQGGDGSHQGSCLDPVEHGVSSRSVLKEKGKGEGQEQVGAADEAAARPQQPGRIRPGRACSLDVPA